MLFIWTSGKILIRKNKKQKESIAKEKSWLVDIKDAKGNTEANSLKQEAELINQKGIYDISLQNPSKKYDLVS